MSVILPRALGSGTSAAPARVGRSGAALVRAVGSCLCSARGTRGSLRAPAARPAKPTRDAAVEQSGRPVSGGGGGAGLRARRLPGYLRPVDRTGREARGAGDQATAGGAAAPASPAAVAA